MSVVNLQNPPQKRYIYMYISINKCQIFACLLDNCLNKKNKSIDLTWGAAKFAIPVSCAVETSRKPAKNHTERSVKNTKYYTRHLCIKLWSIQWWDLATVMCIIICFFVICHHWKMRRGLDKTLSVTLFFF